MDTQEIRDLDGHLQTIRRLFLAAADAGREDDAAALAYAVAHFEDRLDWERQSQYDRDLRHARVRYHNVETQYQRACRHLHLYYWRLNQRGKPEKVPVTDQALQSERQAEEIATAIWPTIDRVLLDESLRICVDTNKPHATRVQIVRPTSLDRDGFHFASALVQSGLCASWCRSQTCPEWIRVTADWDARLTEAERDLASVRERNPSRD